MPGHQISFAGKTNINRHRSARKEAESVAASPGGPLVANTFSEGAAAAPAAPPPRMRSPSAPDLGPNAATSSQRGRREVDLADELLSTNSSASRRRKWGGDAASESAPKTRAERVVRSHAFPPPRASEPAASETDGPSLSARQELAEALRKLDEATSLVRQARRLVRSAVAHLP